MNKLTSKCSFHVSLLIHIRAVGGIAFPDAIGFLRCGGISKRYDYALLKLLIEQ